MKISVQKIIRKVTAVFLSLTLMLTGLCVGFTAAASTDTAYTVYYTAPAIPVNVNTTVPLSGIDFVGEDFVIDGANAFISLTNNSSKGINITPYAICATQKGVYEATVTDNANSMTVYIVAKELQEEKWYLYDRDFTAENWNASDFGEIATPDGWQVQYAKDGFYGGGSVLVNATLPVVTHVAPYSTTGNATKGIVPFYNMYEETNNAEHDANFGFFTLNDPIVNKFADYTIIAKTTTYNPYGESEESGVGLYGRVDLEPNKDGKITNWSPYDNQWNSDRFSVFYVNNGTGLASKNVYHTILGDGAYRQKEVTPISNFSNLATTGADNNGVQLNMILKYEGDIATFGVGDQYVEYNMSTEAGHDAYYDLPGGVGFYTGMIGATDAQNTTWSAIERFSVALNNEPTDCPAYTLDTITANAYMVHEASPAIPMNVDTAVKLDDLVFEIDGEGFVPGGSVSLVSGNGAVRIQDGCITATQIGAYPVTLSYGSTVKTVYVVVKNKNDEKWYLYNHDFTTENYDASDYGEIAIPDEWISNYNMGDNTGNFGKYTHVAPYSTTDAWFGTVNKKVTQGIIPVYNLYEENSSYNYYGSGFFTLNNPIVNAFADYTIESTMRVYDHESDRFSGSGLFGRAPLKNGTFGDYTDSFATFHSNNSRKNDPSNKEYNGTVNLGNVQVSVWYGDLYRSKDPSVIGNFSTYKINDSSAMPVSLSLQYDGNMAYFYDGTDTVAYDLANIAGYDHNYLGNGAVGVFVGNCTVGHQWGTSYSVVETFSVALNNAADDMPASTPIGDITVGAYTVDLDRTPAIPMNKDTYVEISDIEFVYNDIVYDGDSARVMSTSEDIVVADGRIYAYATGIYPVRVTLGNRWAKAYVVVKELTEDKWYLYNEDFTDDYDEYKVGPKNEFPDNWKSQMITSGVFREYPYMGNYVAANVYTDPQSEPMVGANPFDDPYDYGWTDSYLSTARGYFTLTTDVISEFNDFTIYYEGKAYNHYDWSESGTGLFGRAVTENGLITKGVTNSVVAFSANNINTNTGLDYVVDGATMTVKTQTLNSDNASWSTAVRTTNTGRAWANWNTVSRISGNGQNIGTDTKYALKYDGTVATFWNPDNEAAGYYTAAVADGKGSVGVFASCISDGSTYNNYPHTWMSVEKFAVTLNNEAYDAPEYTLVKPLEALGTSIRPDTSNNVSGLRFGIRAHTLKWNGNAVLSDSKITVDGKEYDVIGYGTIMLPTRLLGGNDLVHGIDPDIQDTVLTNYVETNYSYTDFAATLINIPEHYKTLDISARAYISYTDESGDTAYVYSDTITDNFYSVQKKISGIYPLDVIEPDFDAGDFSTFDITYDSMTNQGVWETPDGVFDSEAAALRTEIYNYSDTLKNNGETKYYVDPNASQNGSGTQSSPYNNLASAISRAGSSDVTILIKRGTVVRGNYTVGANVSIGAYGDESLPKPVIMGSDKNYADLTWSETATENVYSVPCTNTQIGNVVFNYGQAIGRDRSSVAELESNFDYYTDGSTLYVYSTVGNPGDICQSIEVSNKIGRAVLVINSYCTVENIQVMFGGAHGIQANDSTGVNIKGTVVGFIGGLPTSSGVKYGNGIELWNDTADAVIDSCYVFQCYDSAVTHQFTDQGTDTSANFNNITYSNNLIEYNFMGFEYFNNTSSTSDSMNNISFDGNIVRFSGYGFGWYTRPDHEVGCDIKGNGVNDNKASNFTVTNNYLDVSRQGLIIVSSTNNNAYIPDFSGNHYAVGTKDCILRTGITGGNHYRAYSEANQISDALAVLGDTTAKLYYINSDK